MIGVNSTGFLNSAISDASAAAGAAVSVVSGFVKTVGSSPGFTGAEGGCKEGAADTAGLGVISDFLGGPEIGWAEVGYGCVVGGYSGFINAIWPGWGNPLNTLDNEKSEIDMYNYVVNGS